MFLGAFFEKAQGLNKLLRCFSSSKMSGRGRGRRAAVKVQPETPIQENEIIEKKEEKEAKEAKPARKTTKKKQFPVVAVITPDGIEGNLLPEVRRPLIVHLPIQSRDISVNDMPISYDPRPPTDAVPYDINADNPYYEGVEPDENNKNEVKDIVETIIHENTSNNTNNNESSKQPEIDYYNLKSTILIQFKDSNEIKSIPQISDIACFWCCHTFSNRPVVLPIRDTGEYLQVTGNFCCPECATSYLFDMRQDSHTRWEQFALLNRVYSEACQGRINPAPSRNILKLFGGNLSIQEYRALIRSHTVRVDVHLPPMVSILATMDTKPIDFYDANLTKNVTETTKERLQKAEEVLRLRRTKPLKAWESTLDACINLKIKA
jgi:hypothetical protein